SEMRLKHAYIIRCEDVVKDSSGRVIELRCSYDPATRGGEAPAGKKIQGTLHWISAPHAVPAEFRIYGPLFAVPDPDKSEDYRAVIDPASLVVMNGFVEPSLSSREAGARFQFLRTGYFCSDPDSTAGKPVFNRIVTLKDSWAKIEKAVRQN
ncbi:MAG: glutamine--tRNA ligase, partial [Candidatus Hydrogenedentota bacterium]